METTHHLPETDRAAEPVAEAFLGKYYDVMKSHPELVHQFYEESSVVSRPGIDGSMTSATTSKVNPGCPIPVADPTRNLVVKLNEEVVRDRAAVTHARPRFEARRLTTAARSTADPVLKTSIYSVAASYPPRNVRFPTLSTFIPNAATLLTLVHFMDFTMSSTKCWTDDCMGWVPPYTMVYISMLFYIQTLRAMVAAGAISPCSEHYLILTSFLTRFPVDNLWIPGPLVQFFKSLSSFRPPDSKDIFGNVSPTLPRTPAWSRNTSYAPPDPVNLHLPNLCALISRLHSVCAVAMTENMTDEIFVNHVDGPRFCSTLFGQACNHSAAELRNMSSPGMNAILVGDLKLWRQAANKLDINGFPHNINLNAACAPDTWNSFLRLDTAAKWMGPVSTMMAKYCQFWRASAPLSDCSPYGSASGSVICRPLDNETSVFDPPEWVEPAGDRNNYAHGHADQIGHYTLFSNHQMVLNSATSVRDLPLAMFYAANTYNINTIVFEANEPEQLEGEFWNVWPNALQCVNVSTLSGVLVSIVRNYHSDTRLGPP